MDRRSVLALLGATALGVERALAQASRPPARLAFVRVSPPIKENVDALEQGLRERGLHPGRNVIIDYRDAGGRPERLPGLLAEIVAAKADVILVSGASVAEVAKRATSTIPIVLTAAGDPLALGLVPSLSRPGGNVTGNSIVNVAIAGKRVELLHALVPGLARIAVLDNAGNPALAAEWEASRKTGTDLGLEAHRIRVAGGSGLEEAFAQIRQTRAQALVVLEDPVFNNERQRLVALAANARLPAIYGQRSHAEAGGLVSYGPNFAQLYRNAAAFVDKILKGAKPGDLPIEQPSTFELVVNLKAANAIGIAVPQSLLVRADEVIR